MGKVTLSCKVSVRLPDLPPSSLNLCGVRACRIGSEKICHVQIRSLSPPLLFYASDRRRVFQCPNSDQQLIEDYQKLLKEDSFADFTIKVGPKETRAHRAILAARSVVFAAMLTHDTGEAKNVSRRCHIILLFDPPKSRMLSSLGGIGNQGSRLRRCDGNAKLYLLGALSARAERDGGGAVGGGG